MLVLTRREQQKIVLDNGVTITVTKIKGESVQLGIDAPSDVKILRQELVDREHGSM